MTTNDARRGLSQEQAAVRLARDGHNELPSAKPRSLIAIAAKVVREPMFLLLIVCGAIYLLLGDRTEALMLLGFVLVVQGKGMAQTLATGQHTAIGRIGKALAALKQEPTRIQQETARIVKRLAWLGFALSLAVAVAYALLRGDWLNGFLVGITLAMAILPEELPVVMTIFLGLGAWRIAQQRVLTRHIPAVEMLGSATVPWWTRPGR